MKILIPGGSGQVGTLLARSFHARGEQVVVLGRDPQPAPWRTLPWDGRSAGPWADELDGADILVNLAGRNVNGSYTRANRDEIMRSRVDSTRVLAQAIAAAAHPPRLWLQASTATIYAHRTDAANDEDAGLIGGDEPDAPASWAFSIEVARAWEQAADELPLPSTRIVKLRSAMTMSPDPGGVFDTLLGLVRAGLGGTCGPGTQYVSWIHDQDLLRAVDWLIAREHLSGPVNLSSPGPFPNRDFMAALRAAWGTSVGLPATRWMLELGAVFLKTETELVLKSRRVVPGRLLEDGFAFGFAQWPAAAEDLCARWRTLRA